ncbi:ribonuclease HII [Pedomonas mirosovicensis]|uniref:ribonuclease HII n=1 Tax=Pedomonas mirosovicensis TaxID=2908641 RepID=UPI0021690A10|nr:ribonuclease HII [Pedomonas mirosovicensis]MCH8685648.1 ribonuclease HII [Pedomonas mirosovicensis]
MAKILPTLELELAHAATCGGLVAGIDEAGRGPLAGPVIAAAVVLDPNRIPVGIADSKALARAKREALLEELLLAAHVGIGEASADEIDQINILQATLLAMRRAVEALPVRPAVALVDGNRAPKLPIPCQTVVKGDATCLSIAAASIVAKVTRDRIMDRLALEHPGFGWERNAGYGTAEHLAALRQIGPTPHHRRSFAPVRELFEQEVAG